MRKYESGYKSPEFWKRHPVSWYIPNLPFATGGYIVLMFVCLWERAHKKTALLNVVLISLLLNTCIVSTKTAQEKLKKKNGYYKFWSVKIGSVICMLSTNIVFITSIEYHYLCVGKQGTVNHIFRKAGTLRSRPRCRHKLSNGTRTLLFRGDLLTETGEDFIFFEKTDRKCEYYHEL